MTRLRIALEWFLNPDHLPLIAARERLRDAGLDLELVVPDDHYDGFEALARGEVELVVNEPLHLVERRGLKLRAHGCFFATDGGVLMQRSGLRRLLAGDVVRIASPVSTPTTDALCADIVQGWVAGQGGALEPGQLQIEAAGFAHVDNLAAGYDGAWLAFANVEGVSARVRGAADADEAVRAAIGQLVAALDVVTPELKADPAAARALWYAASGEAVSAEADAIVEASLPRFLAPVRPDSGMWRPMWRYVQSRGGDVVDAETFEAMFA
jgi:ABC-type nitrate/sulfonate/bicarbonate transport system substrate-binding protein